MKKLKYKSYESDSDEGVTVGSICLPLAAEILTLRRRWSDFFLLNRQSDVNQSDLEPYLPDITSQ